MDGDGDGLMAGADDLALESSRAGHEAEGCPAPTEGVRLEIVVKVERNCAPGDDGGGNDEDDSCQAGEERGFY